MNSLHKLYLFRFLGNLHLIAGVLVPFFTIWGGLNLTKVFILQSWFSIWVILLEIPTGTIADFLGRKTSLVLGAIITAFAALVYSSYPNFYIFLAGEFLWALSASLISGSAEAFIYEAAIEQGIATNRAFAKFRTAGLIALVLAAPFGSVVAAYLGLRFTMALISIPSVGAAVVGFTLKEPKKFKRVTKKNYFKILKEGVIYFARHKTLKILAFDMIVVASLSFLYIWLYQPALQKAGLNLAYFGLVHAGLVLSEMAVVNNFSLFERLLGGKRKYLLLSALFAGSMLLLMGSLWLPAVTLGTIIGAGFGLTREVRFQSYFNQYIPTNKRATVLSTISMFKRLFLVGVYPIVGLLADWSLSYTLIILGTVIIVFTLFSRIEEKMLREKY